MNKYVVVDEDPRGDIFTVICDTQSEANSIALDKWMSYSINARNKAKVYTGFYDTEDFSPDIDEDHWILDYMQSDETCFSSEELLEKARRADSALACVDEKSLEALATYVDTCTADDFGSRLEEALDMMRLCVEETFDKFGVTYQMRKRW